MGPSFQPHIVEDGLQTSFLYVASGQFLKPGKRLLQEEGI